MSDNEVKKTHYDVKMEQRKAAKEKEARDAKIGTAFGILVIIGLIALIASFPLKSYLAVNRTVVTVAGEAVSQVEFDYYYNIVSRNFLNTTGQYLSYYGIDVNGDLSGVMFDENLTFPEYFEELTVEHIAESKSLTNEAKSKGFTYDTDEEYNRFIQGVTKKAKEEGKAVKAYICDTYGDYATEDRLEPFVRNSYFVSAYYDQVSKDNAPSDEAKTAYYNENKSEYDQVTYRYITVDAQLSKEPTELADEGAAVAEDGSYTPSQAEIDAAMAEAKEKAEDAKSTIDELGLLCENYPKSQAGYYYRDWLFEDGRKAGETTVVENAASHNYYVVQFVERSLDDAPTYNVRAIGSEKVSGEEIVAAYEAGAKTEDSFIELVAKYSDDEDAVSNEGLFLNQNPKDLQDDMAEWLTDSSRKAGDVASFLVADQYNFVLYYIEESQPAYLASIEDILKNEFMESYVDALIDATPVEGNLKYLEVRAQQEAAEAEATESADATDAATESPESAE